MKTIHFSILFLAFLLVYCTSDDIEPQNPDTTASAEVSGLNADFTFDGQERLQNQSSTSTPIALKKMTESIINWESLKTLKNRRPNLYKRLRFKGNVLKQGPGYAIYEGGSLSVIVPTKDIEGDPPVESTIYISGYEKVPIDIIGKYVLYAICECVDGVDDCKFDRNRDGSLGECNGTCDCRGGFELCGPGDNILEVQANF